MRFFKSPFLVKKLLSDYTWNRSGKEKTLYLTFDDGPIPVVTPFVLEQLEKYKAKATFFCVGENLSKHPAIAEQVLAAGHVLANHTYNHLKGWQTPLHDYLRNVQLCQEELEAVQKFSRPRKKLFRPPHGRISRSQAAALKEQYELVMWDVISYDFDASLSPEACLQKSIRHTRNGSIIVFHDSLKAQRNMMYALPLFLEHFTAAGYTFETL
ncbi:polysaccharide deacetylase family protein [Pontibacter sp. SGAir0037]|uniref:polysaccharide deacetylase family protein n=1 Tax=Pontibacter sp. SGAir0037 TaxID=2571030 RepID=UPI0010CCEC96|nr:polysaccharide deacetylase family protein [Pontibacter sp. SGAir0037]QCR22419.1 polysaccharide deacetylase family protein [Pontibacter sp. SGAir0037]